MLVSIPSIATLVSLIACSKAISLPQNISYGGVAAISGSDVPAAKCHENPSGSGLIVLGEDCSALIRSSLLHWYQYDEKKETFYRQGKGGEERKPGWIDAPYIRRSMPHAKRNSCQLVVDTKQPNVKGLATWMELTIAAREIVTSCINSGTHYGGTIDAGDGGLLQIRLDGQPSRADQRPSSPLVGGATNLSAAS